MISAFNDITVKVITEDGNAGSFEIAPLPRGYGHTLANSLRRILLSSLPGAGITSVYVPKVDHEYVSIDGIKEDLIEIILNLKSLDLKSTSSEPVICKISVDAKGEVTGKDIVVGAGVEVTNPDVHILTATAKTEFYLEFVVEQGIGYLEAQEGLRKEKGRVPVDADFSPVKNVRFEVRNTRKGQETDLDLVSIVIDTDGSMSPRDAMLESAKILQDFAGKVMASLGVPVEDVDKMAVDAQIIIKDEVEEEEVNEVSTWKIEDLPISKRSKTGLLAGGYEKVGDLDGVNINDLLGLPGFGNKSLNEVTELMKQYGIEIITD